MADAAEYGDVSPADIVPIGRIISRSPPHFAIQAESGAISGSSPMPQLVLEAAENNGTSIPV